MALCERCEAELGGKAETLPAPWFDTAKHRIAGTPVEPMVWRLLELMWHRRNKGWFSTGQGMALLYGDRPDPPYDKLITFYICKLRRLLDPTPYAIASKWHEGWMIVDRALVAVKTDAVIGEPEDGVRRLPSRARGTAGQDKYGFRQLKPGQSRVIGNATLARLRAVCRVARLRGDGTFEAGYAADGQMRIWRLE
jgi:hypothetical protein